MDTIYVHVCIQIFIHTCTYVGIHISKYSPSKSCLEEIANYDIALHCSTVFVFDSTLADPVKYVLPCFSLVLNFLKKTFVFFFTFSFLQYKPYPNNNAHRKQNYPIRCKPIGSYACTTPFGNSFLFIYIYILFFIP